MNYHRARQAGLSLVELMVALVLGLLLSAGVITIFISAKQDYQVQDAVSQVQENGRFSLEFLSSDIRMAGYTGCSNEMPTANSVENPPPSLASFGEGIEGFTGTPPAAQFPDALAGTDAVIVHMADTDNEFPVTNHNPDAAQISIVGTHEFDVGSILMIVDSDCSSQGIFLLTGPSSGTKNNAVHNTGKTFTVGGTSGVGNCTKALKGNFDCDNTAGASSTAYSDGSTVFSIKSIGYYIKDPDKVATISSPTLYRVNLGAAYLGGSTTEQPLVEGVSDLEILYGVRDGSNIQYKTADVVEAADEWNDVIAVRLDVEAQSLTQVDGAPIVRNFVRTVRLRNR
ncbi:PilW family protein [Marinobacter sp. TBZ242]|uniref:PilW family protein n=1 Tax=Marinobacter azerbaijanicus TaxID=3050455 RepID=A0ABT7IGX4_9GAMM|nr:PilW family protein [Marinobacter sp. TBZ242]MDL0433415.1 PilW family protein [Marinobacter sp. TBZ242]